jgi:hypothetical protein
MAIAEGPASRGRILRHRADEALDALAAAIAASADIPDPARADLEATVQRLRSQAQDLEVEIERLEAAVGAPGAPPAEIASIRARVDRLRTLQRAGDTVDGRDLARLEATLEQHEADLLAEEQVEQRLSACCAELLEIASTASRVRRELVAAPRDRASADEAVAALRREAQLADRARRARREAGVRATLAGSAR